jgi:UDPglucose--hexose-1-phosphate uridylyltransferase
MTDGEVCDIIRTYKARYSAIQGRPGIQAITIFKNHGPAAGCSKEHPHSQLVATPVVPHRIRSIVENAVEYYDVNNKCMFCQGIELELKEKKRLVLETDKFVSFMPYAGVAPFVMMICPKRHVPSFDAIDEGEIKDLARILKTTLAKLYHGLNDPDFNYTIRSVPVKEKWNEAFHWSISVIPRLTNPAGFELGSGMFINASIPEEGAEFLRNQKA